MFEGNKATKIKIKLKPKHFKRNYVNFKLSIQPFDQGNKFQWTNQILSKLNGKTIFIASFFIQEGIYFRFIYLNTKCILILKLNHSILYLSWFLFDYFFAFFAYLSTFFEWIGRGKFPGKATAFLCRRHKI